MKTIRSYRMLTAVLAAIMMISLLSACGSGGGNGNQGSKPDNAAQGDNAGSKDNTGAAGDSGNGEVKELSLFIDAPWYPVKEWKGPVADKITEKTGVKLKVTVATDDKQLPLMIASGDLPDLVFTYSNVGRMSDSKLSYPWNELIEKYAPDFKIDKTRIAIHTMDDGNFYTVRNSFATQEEMKQNKYSIGSDGNPGIAVREDILKELGNPPINSLDDFVKVLGMVKKKYPDMVPLIMDKDWLEQYFLQQFGTGVLLDGWYEQDGKVDYSIRQPKMLEFFKFMNSLYRNGYILAENFALANDQIDDQYATNGKAFAHSHTVATADTDNIKIKSSGSGSYTFKMLPSALTKDAKVVSTGLGFAGTFITKKNKDPETSIKFLQYLASDEGKKLTMFGVEGEHWTWNNEGHPDLKYNPSDADFVNGNGIKWWYLYNDGVTEGMLSYVPGLQKTQALMQTKAITVYKPQIGLIQAQPDSEEKTIKTKIDEMVKNEKVRIYLANSEEEAVANYNSMVKKAEDMGLQKLVDWANATYNKKKDLFK
ncbi:ABC transporter substrate-binding protein [Paenibacillus riograndensis]|uniref:ABC transporter substrate-binding protein n=1 Tax=Paenibacillus riograndensis TaxID=483937 RepID=A0A132TTK6_9BACL|nr:extracellular solute-binding protein [Paenibacillus riograndensis]KWX74416.1 ABC transporter substrate-binding protein [Paenibacillus riograndensis]